jgi:tetratricopeptide (TPR) repeat protein
MATLLEQLDAARAAAAAQPDSAPVQQALDELMLQMEDPEPVLAHFAARLAAAQGDEAAGIALHLADLQVQRQDNVPAAVATLTAQVEQTPGHAALWERLIALHRLEGQATAAVACMQASLRLLPEGPPRQAKLLELAKYAMDQQLPPQVALAALRSALVTAPKDIAVQELLRALLQATSETSGSGGHSGSMAAASTGRTDDTSGASGSDGQKGAGGSSGNSGAGASDYAEVLDAVIAAELAAQRYADAAPLLLRKAEASNSAAAAVACLRQLAQLREAHLQDPRGAFGDLQRAFTLLPLDPGLQGDLEDLAQRHGLHVELAEAYSSALSMPADAATAPTAEHRRQLRRRLAEILDVQLHRGAEALSYYCAPADAQATAGETPFAAQLPDDLAGLQAVARLCRTGERPAELALALEALLQRSSLQHEGQHPGQNQSQQPQEVQRRVATLRELADLYHGPLGDGGRASACLRQLLELAPRDEAALRGLCSLTDTPETVAEQLGILTRLIDLGAQNSHLLDDLVTRGELQLQMQAYDEAYKSFRAVLLKKRDHPQAIFGLEQVAPHLGAPAELTQLLEPVYTAAEQHDKLAWLLELRLQEVTDAPARKALLRRIGDIYENRLGQKDRAFMMARRSLAADPADMGVRMWLEKLAQQTDATLELAQIYVEEAQGPDPTLQLQFLRRAAALYHDKLGDDSAAIAQYQAIVGLEPRDDKALAGLESLYTKRQEPGPLCDILQRRLQMTAGLERKQKLMAEIATLQAERLSDLPAAVATLNTLLALLPDDAAAFDRREALLQQLNDFTALSAMYRDEAERLQARRSRDAISRRLLLQHRRAVLLEDPLGDAAQSYALCAQILQEEPGHAPTVQHLQARSKAGCRPATRLLAQVYRAQKDDAAYVQCLHTLLAQTSAVPERRTVHLQVAAFYDAQPQQGTMALLALARAYQENRADAEVLEQLQALAQRHSLLDELVQILSTDLDGIADPALRQSLLHRLGDLCKDHLHDAAEAAQFYGQALQDEPSDPYALAALDALFLAQSDWPNLKANLQRQVDLGLPAKDGQRGALERLAEVLSEHLHDAQGALRCHKQILSQDPDNLVSLQRMQRLFAEVADWDSLLSNLQHQARLATDPADKVRIYAALGTLHAEEFGNNTASIEAWQQVVQSAPDHEEGGQALQILLTAEERWEDLAALYRGQLALCRDADERLDINRRLGVILGDKLHRSDDAVKSWEKVLEQDVKNTEALEALCALYKERGLWQNYASMVRRLLALSPPAQAKALRLDLAEAQGLHLEARDEAIRLGREVRATEPHTAEQMQRLAELMVALSAWDEAAICLEKAAGLQPEAAPRVLLYRRAVQVHTEELQRPHAARSALEGILQATPDDAAAFAQLTTVLRETQAHRELVAVLQAYLVHAAAAQRLPILVEVRDTLQGALADHDMAFLAACRVVQEQPADVQAAELAIAMARANDNVEEVVTVLQEALPEVADVRIRSHLLQRTAELQAKDLSLWTEAEQTLEQAAGLLPEDAAPLNALAQMAASQERFDKQLAYLERKLAIAPEAADKKLLLQEMAHLWEDKLDEPLRAAQTLQRILSFAGSDTQTLAELLRLYEECALWPEVLQVLQRCLELPADQAVHVAQRLRAAVLCENELDQVEQSLSWYRSVLDYEPHNAAALSALERQYTALKRYTELIQVLEQRLAVAATDAEKIAQLSKMATLQEQEFGSLADAVACLERCLLIEPLHPATLKQLAKLLRTLRDWPRLIEIVTLLEQVAAREGDTAGRCAYLLELGEIYYRELSRVDRAEAIYTQALAVDAQNPAALHALGKLYERSGNWFVALEMLQRELDAPGVRGDAPRGLPLLWRMGKIQEDILGDPEAARATFERALQLDPADAVALGHLKEQARTRADWPRYAEYLITEAETADDAEVQAELFVEAAQFFQHVKADPAGAERFYRRVLALQAHHVVANAALAELTFRDLRFAEAQKLYSGIAQRLAATSDARTIAQTYYRLGYCHEKLQETDAALQAYRRAFAADATYLPALEGLGQALLAAGLWDEAQKVFQTVLIHHRDALTESEVVDIVWQLGDLLLRQGQPDAASKQFLKALSLQPDHAPSLRAAADLACAQAAWPEAYAHLRRLAEVAPVQERRQTLVRMAAVARDHLRDPLRVLEALEQARRLPDPPLEVVQQLAEAYLQNNQAQKAVEALGHCVALCTQDVQRAELLYRMGLLYEEQLLNPPQAVQKYNEALDASATVLKAFARIEQLLGHSQEWGILETNYRAMLARVQSDSPAKRVVLWQALASLYHHRLQHHDHAIMAYEVLLQLEPHNGAHQDALAELYGLAPQTRHRAITMQHQRLLAAPNPVAILRVLIGLYRQDRNFDAVYCLCAALVLLGQADAEEQKMHTYLARGLPAKAMRGLGEDQWAAVLLPALHGPLGKLVTLLYRLAPTFVTVPAKDLGLKKKDQIQVQSSELYFATLVSQTAQTLGLPTVDVYRKPGSLEGLRLINCQPPALLAGETHSVLRDMPPKDVAFHLGQALSGVRPELFLPRVFTSVALRDLLFGLMQVFNRALPHTGDRRAVQVWCETFEKLPPEALKVLRPAVQAAYADLSDAKAFQEFVHSAQIVGLRAGLMAVHDLAVAARGANDSAAPSSVDPGTLSVRDRLRALVLFATGQEYLQVRRICGAGIAETA